jgi:hypothetical protein
MLCGVDGLDHFCCCLVEVAAIFWHATVTRHLCEAALLGRMKTTFTLLLLLLVHTLFLYLFDSLFRVNDRSRLDIQLLCGRVSHMVPEPAA